jgi:hypothetical protein
MNSNDRFTNALIRCLRTETADHPRIDEAVYAASTFLEAIEWDDGGRPLGTAPDCAADAVEDWLGYEGVHLPTETAINWRPIFRCALRDAKKGVL